MRVNKSHIINLSRVDSYTKTTIILFDYPTPIPMGEKYRYEFMHWQQSKFN